MKYLYTINQNYFGEIKYRKDIFSDYKQHFHNSLSFSIITDGKLEILYDTISKKTLDSNLVAVFNPSQLHCTKNINASGYYTLYLNYDWCKNIQDELFGNNIFFIPLNTNLIYHKELSDIIKFIYNTEDSSLIHHDSLRDIIKDVFIKFCDISVLINTYSEKHIVKSIKNYIYDNIEQQITLDDVAKHFKYDKSYLIRIFKKETATTPQNFIINEKIHKAKELIIKNKDTNLSNLAVDIGFYDQSHLNRNFKRIFAANPKYYQNTK